MCHCRLTRRNVAHMYNLLSLWLVKLNMASEMSLANLHNTPCRLYISEVRSLKENASTRTFFPCRSPIFKQLKNGFKLSTCFWNLHRIREFYEGDTMVAKIPLCPVKSQNRLFPSCHFASLSKRVYMQDHSYENAFHEFIFVQVKLIFTR